jgi:hypothetical protein
LGNVEPSVSDVILPADSAVPIDASIQETPATSNDEISPSWLDEFVAAGTASAMQRENPTIPAEEVPDWLTGYNDTPLSDESQLSSAVNDVDVGSLDWLDEERHTLDSATEQSRPEPEIVEPGIAPFEFEAESQPFMSGELPEWLGKESENIQPLEAQPTSSQEGEDLARADLPSWLESMRPIDAAALPVAVAESRDKQLEGTGPLAGLRSVLPSEFELGARSAPAAYTVKLQVSDTQKSHAAIIEELIKSEGETGEVPGRRAMDPQKFLLIGIFAILLLALLWPMFNKRQSVELPPSGTAVMDASNAIGNLPGAAPVLLAVDYEPGLAGEMEATASAVLDHLMLKGAYLTLVSTAPTGPAQAERLVQGVNLRGEHAYQGSDTYANLGFIPGGLVGIRSFAESPRRVMPFALDGTEVWKAGPLASVQKLSDFAMVLVITESPATARSWIEQVKPLQGDKPLLMVVSAQAEPVVRPYFDGEPQSIQGIVAGLPGGASYENLIGRINLARQYWDAYSIGISLIALLLLVGGTVSIILHYIRGRKQAGGAI